MNGGRFKYIALAVIVPLSVGLDQWTKYLARALEFRPPVEVIPGFFSLRFVVNRGSAWGLFADTADSFRLPFFIGVTLVALLLMGWYFVKLGAGQRLLALAFSMIIGGAIGNFIDRLLYGQVVDFIDWYWRTWHWPTFNIADSFISVGIGLFILDLLVSRPPAPGEG